MTFKIALMVNDFNYIETPDVSVILTRLQVTFIDGHQFIHLAAKPALRIFCCFLASYCTGKERHLFLFLEVRELEWT